MTVFKEKNKDKRGSLKLAVIYFPFLGVTGQLEFHKPARLTAVGREENYLTPIKEILISITQNALTPDT